MTKAVHPNDALFSGENRSPLFQPANIMREAKTDTQGVCSCRINSDRYSM